MKRCHLIDDGRHTCDVERAIGTGEDVGTYFDGDAEWGHVWGLRGV